MTHEKSTRSYRLSAIALGLTLLAAFANAQPANRDSGRPASTTQRASAPQAKPAPSPPVTIQSVDERIAAALKAQEAKQETSEEKKRADADLKAQQDMAGWARVMAYIGGAEAGITFCGVLLVLATLIYTKRAAEAARDAVTEAQEATKAANETIAQAERHANIQLRAYIFGEHFQCKANTASVPNPGGAVAEIESYEISLPFKNFGSTPAQNVFSWVSAVMHPMNQDDALQFNRPIGGSYVLCGPGGTAATGAVAIPIAVAMECWNRETEIVIYARIEYKDVFEPKIVRYTEYCSRLEPLYPPNERRDPRISTFGFMGFGPHNVST